MLTLINVDGEEVPTDGTRVESRVSRSRSDDGLELTLAIVETTIASVLSTDF